MPTLSSYQAEVGPVDVAVIGAGINGLAVAREAAARGMSVLLIDQDDVGAKTSAISTRLIHGGLKYLERVQLSLVHESIRERNILLAQAPHLVRPYPMLIPFSRSQSRPGWLLACGLLLHDVLSLGKRLPRNRLVTRRQIKRRWPSIGASGLRWGGLFQDAHVPLTERLSVELAIDAHQRGAVVLTHAPVVELVRTGGGVTGLRYRDRADGTLKEVAASVVVNAAGPWIDDVLAMAGVNDRRIGPTKGSHCVVDAFEGAPDTCVFFESPRDARPMFVLPWAGRYMIGTTDLPYDGPLDEIVIDEAEVDYLLSAVNTLIPTAALTADDVLWSYSGVRPLPYVDDLRDPASVSREHQVITHRGTESGLVTIVGGKLTTHRSLGEEVAGILERLLGRPRRPSPTREAPLPGAPVGEDWDVARARLIESSSLPGHVATRLVDTYGRAGAEIEALVRQDPDLGAVVDADSGAIAAEVVHAVRTEGAFTLEDVILRRTLVGINADVGLSAAPAVAQVLVDKCGWTPERADEQLDAYRRSMSRFRPRALRTTPTANHP